MKSYHKVLFAFALSFVMFNVSAQTPSQQQGWPVSKDVQRYSNKNLATHKPARIKSVGTPVFVQSKGVHKINSNEAPVSGNMQSNFPSWIISKPVNLIRK
ncbi:MAG: hypothetical protein JNM57_08680 [Cyclobacteriaceae bacterium]|nr:hypothetical protein [Cyclobacteriaceae bacterium]